MSLTKQLWIAIALVTTLALGGSLVIGTLTARHYLAQQLYLKNVDNATSLALSMSQMPKDEVTLELLLSAQFDAGHYRRITLLAPDGRTLVERIDAAGATGAPSWFASLVPLSARPGSAQVQDGWHQFGTLQVESHSRYAYQSLWEGTLRQLAWFCVAAMLTGVAGTFLLRHITRPLQRVVDQAEAIGGRRFVTTEEPRTTEFRSVVKAMNQLSERVRAMFAEESRRLETLRRQVQEDALTGLLNRRQFLNQLSSALARDDAGAGGVLLVAKIGDLNTLNHAIGRAATDALLRALADVARDFTTHGPGREAGRLNGSELAVLVPGGEDVDTLAAALLEGLATVRRAALGDRPAAAGVALAAAAYRSGDAAATLLARLDTALASAEARGGDNYAVGDDRSASKGDRLAWRNAIEAALDADGVRLQTYPVVAADGVLLHHEAPVRLLLDGAWRNAGYFMPWALRLELAARIDLEVAAAALTHIVSTGEPVGVNLSVQSLADGGFRARLLALLKGRPKAATRLWLEAAEHDVITHRADFQALCLSLKPLGCRIGIEHVDQHFGRIGNLHELGIDYLKLDASMVRGIDADGGNQSVVRGLSVIAHAIGLLVIAEGVSTPEEHACLLELGLDGVTGPAVRR